ncbi:hypothetical protein B0H13DRAFT_2576893 [Mycena leptocephala]|nr:hypothetical protein B0H13DRAFT_2576893 [Mycena leptocephala]
MHAVGISLMVRSNSQSTHPQPPRSSLCAPPSLVPSAGSPNGPVPDTACKPPTTVDAAHGSPVIRYACGKRPRGRGGDAALLAYGGLVSIPRIPSPPFLPPYLPPMIARAGSPRVLPAFISAPNPLSPHFGATHAGRPARMLRHPETRTRDKGAGCHEGERKLIHCALWRISDYVRAVSASIHLASVSVLVHRCTPPSARARPSASSLKCLSLPLLFPLLRSLPPAPRLFVSGIHLAARMTAVVGSWRVAVRSTTSIKRTFPSALVLDHPSSCCYSQVARSPSSPLTSSPAKRLAVLGSALLNVGARADVGLYSLRGRRVGASATELVLCFIQNAVWTWMCAVPRATALYDPVRTRDIRRGLREFPVRLQWRCDTPRSGGRRMRGVRVHELLPIMHGLVPASCHGYVGLRTHRLGHVHERHASHSVPLSFRTRTPHRTPSSDGRAPDSEQRRSQPTPFLPLMRLSWIAKRVPGGAGMPMSVWHHLWIRTRTMGGMGMGRSLLGHECPRARRDCVLDRTETDSLERGTS